MESEERKLKQYQHRTVLNKFHKQAKLLVGTAKKINFILSTEVFHISIKPMNYKPTLRYLIRNS